MQTKSNFLATWRESRVSAHATIRDALFAINRSGALMACVVSDDGVLKGILTDSDIRRALLNGAALDDAIVTWVNSRPVVALADAQPQELIRVAKSHSVRELPLVDSEGKLVDIFVLIVHDTRHLVAESQQQTAAAELPNAMLILAGGLGTRLRSIVSDRPKPLAVVGDRPVLETLISRASAEGIRHFYVAVNYMADLVQEHLASPVYTGLDIKVVREPIRLGTAGAIGLIKEDINHPLLVCNADVLTTVPYAQILHHHIRDGADVTCTVRPYKVKIPYGVLDIQDGQIQAIREKPETAYMVNAGIYALSPHICRLVEPNVYLDMPDLVSRIMQRGQRAIAFLLHEYWIDIGQPDDFHRANAEYRTYFGDSK